MPSHLKRDHTFGHNHFVTFSGYQRLPYPNNDQARLLPKPNDGSMKGSFPEEGGASGILREVLEDKGTNLELLPNLHFELISTRG